VSAFAATSLVELVEELGPRVDNGGLSEEHAIRLVFEFSDGGLTRVGAQSVLAQWKTLRARLTREIAETRARLDQLGGGAT